MKPRRTNGRTGRLLLSLSLALLTFTAPPLASAQQPAEPPAPLTDLPRLATAGDFDSVAASLRADDKHAQDPQVLALLRDLERARTNKAERDARRREAFDAAVEKMNTAVKEGKLDEAVLRAVEAQGLADDGEAFRNGDAAKKVVAATAESARGAETAGDWLEALTLYRGLNLLYDDQVHFRDETQRIERRVRQLRMYAPEQLKKLYEAQARKRAEDPDEEIEPIRLGDETWDDRLKGVNVSMLRQAIALAARHHVSNPSYAPLLRGAADAMLNFIDTRGLDQTFPSLGEPEKVRDFRAGLMRIRKSIDERGGNIQQFDALAITDQMLSLNADTIKLPEPVVVYELADGALAPLDDFTSVIWPRDKEQFSRNTQGKFYGVGIQISRRDGQLIVVSPLANTPAMEVGVKAGDIIAKVNGEATMHWTLEKAVREITGPEGTLVTLCIQRVGHTDLLEYQITRAEIPIESIRGWEHLPNGDWTWYIDEPSRIGYIRLSQFIPQSADDLDHAINQMAQDKGLNGLILDLRFNPGGLLSSAIDISDRFISRGPIVSTVDGQDQKTHEFRAHREKTHPRFPVVVLINQGSASASEIVSGALQDYGRATIVGERSFGKGSVQDLYAIERGDGYLKLTTQYYKLPKGRIIHRKPGDSKWGVEPDLVVKMTSQQVADSIEYRQKVDVLRGKDEQPAEGEDPAKASEILARSLDPQLESALLLLKTQLVSDQLKVAQRDEAVRTP